MHVFVLFLSLYIFVGVENSLEASTDYLYPLEKGSLTVETESTIKNSEEIVPLVSDPLALEKEICLADDGCNTCCTEDPCQEESCCCCSEPEDDLTGLAGTSGSGAASGGATSGGYGGGGFFAGEGGGGNSSNGGEGTEGGPDNGGPELEIPEPSTWLILGSLLMLVAAINYRKRQSSNYSSSSLKR